ncbi:MAG: hypothetical protein AAF333_04145 [Planctomycetota bacterium]
MPNPPSTNGANGRNARGQFTTGNAGGPGNPHAKKVAALRATLMKTVTHRDLQAIVKGLIERAKAGDVLAAREVLDRCFGKPRQGVDMDVGMELATPPGPLDFAQMTDLQIAEVIEAADLPLPPILRAKIDLIRSQPAAPDALPKPPPEVPAKRRRSTSAKASTPAVPKKKPRKKSPRKRRDG